MRLSWAHVVRAKKILGFFVDVVPLLPSTGDGPLQVIVKTLGAVSLGLNLIEATSVEEELVRFGAGALQQHQNIFFVEALTQTNLAQLFKARTFKFPNPGTTTEYTNATNYKSNLGSIWVLGSSDYRYSSDFWTEGHVDIDRILQALWSNLGGALIVGSEEIYNYRRVLYATLPHITDPVLGSGQAMLEKLGARHKLFQQHNQSRSYLFIGAPGTGKTTQALAFAQSFSDRVMCLDASIFEGSLGNLDQLLEGLCPDFVIADDIDHVSGWRLPGILAGLDRLKRKFPKIVFIYTANKIENLPEPMVRPGRIDDVILFPLPDFTDRVNVIQGYLRQLGANIPQADVAAVAEACEGLSQAFLRNYAIHLSQEPIKDVLEGVKARKSLMKMEKKDNDASSPDDKL